MSSDSVEPIKSQHEKFPWEPTIDTSDGPQKKAGEDYTRVYGGTVQNGKSSGDDNDEVEKSGREPILTMTYTTAPDFIPSADSGSGGTDGPSALESGRFTVQLATLHSTEQDCLTATSAMVDGFDTVKGEVDKAAADDNFFGQHVGKWQRTESGKNGIQTQWQDDKYDEEAQHFADAIIPQMKNLLNSIGSAIEACGQFNALLNNAGQIYATIDHNAEFKDA
ncbi:hypothetical protein [Actinacidiphila reveromycinica]|nr:hypothetical protein [Streptomyces sp. SN-593]